MNTYLSEWANKPLISELSDGVINAPQDLLGCHEYKKGRTTVQIFTAYRPCAWHVWLINSKGDEIGELERM